MSFKKPTADASDKSERNNNQDSLAMGNKPFEKVDPTDMANDSKYVDYFEEQRQKAKAFSHSTTKPVTYNIAVSDESTVPGLSKNNRAKPDVAQEKKRSKSLSLGNITNPFRTRSSSLQNKPKIQQSFKGPLDERDNMSVTGLNANSVDIRPGVSVATKDINVMNAKSTNNQQAFGKFIDRGSCPERGRAPRNTHHETLDPLEVHDNLYTIPPVSENPSKNKDATSKLGSSPNKRVSFDEGANGNKTDDPVKRKNVNDDSHEADMMRRKSSSIEEVYKTTKGYDDYNKNQEIPLSTIVGTVGGDESLIDEFNRTLSNKKDTSTGKAMAFNTPPLSSQEVEKVNRISRPQSLDPFVMDNDPTIASQVKTMNDSTSQNLKHHNDDSEPRKSLVNMFDNIEGSEKHMFQKQNVNPNELDISEVSKKPTDDSYSNVKPRVNVNTNFSTESKSASTLDPSVKRQAIKMMNNPIDTEIGRNEKMSSLKKENDDMYVGNTIKKMENSADQMTGGNEKISATNKTEKNIDDKISEGTKKSLLTSRNENEIPQYRSLIPGETPNTSTSEKGNHGSKISTPQNKNLLAELPQGSNLIESTADEPEKAAFAQSSGNKDSEHVEDRYLQSSVLSPESGNGQKDVGIKGKQATTSDYQSDGLTDFVAHNRGRKVTRTVPNDDSYGELNPIRQMNISEPKDKENEEYVKRQMGKSRSHHTSGNINPIKSMNISEPKTKDAEMYVQREMDTGKNDFKSHNALGSMNVAEPDFSERNNGSDDLNMATKKQAPLSLAVNQSEATGEPSLSSRRSLKSENFDDLDRPLGKYRSSHRSDEQQTGNSPTGEHNNLKYHNSLVDPSVPTYGAVSAGARGDHLIAGSPMNYNYHSNKHSNLKDATPRSSATTKRQTGTRHTKQDKSKVATQ